MSTHTPAKELVKDLLDAIDNDNGVLYGNRRDLITLDAEELDRYVGALHDQIEETEYIIYNPEDWIDELLPEQINELKTDILNEVDIDDDTVTELLEGFTKDLTEKIKKQIMVELEKVAKVYTEVV